MAADKARKKSRGIPGHESAVRRITSEFQGEEYHPLRSLEEAKPFPGGVVILEGDDGGQIYVVCPASLGKCSIKSLNKLLRDLDEIAWPGNFSHTRGVLYERRPTGSGVAGGMGGAVVLDGAWVREEFVDIGDAIREVIEGKRAAFPMPPDERCGRPVRGLNVIRKAWVLG